MKKARLYVPICGIRVPVRVGSADDYEPLEGCYAVYDLDTGTIWISEDCPENEVDFWLTHEALHALLNRSGANRCIAALMGLDLEDKKAGKTLDVCEENLIRILVPHFLETFGPVRSCK